MASRLKLQSELEEKLGSKNVYYNPPETVKMNYPAIVYKKKTLLRIFASNSSYKQSQGYEITVIDHRPDNPVIEKLLELPYCSYDSHYTADNLNHDKLTIYY